MSELTHALSKPSTSETASPAGRGAPSGRTDEPPVPDEQVGETAPSHDYPIGHPAPSHLVSGPSTLDSADGSPVPARRTSRPWVSGDRVRLAVFAAMLVVVFGVAFGVGKLTGDPAPPVPAPTSDRHHSHAGGHS